MGHPDFPGFEFVETKETELPDGTIQVDVYPSSTSEVSPPPEPSETNPHTSRE